ncbi:MAG: arginine--tRNA ligase [Bacteroidales bacterium]|nr:arginine--tRNA ligase [Bacteroidales bacterium]
MFIENFISGEVNKALNSIFNIELNETKVSVEYTKKDFEGDFTVNVFPFLKITGGKPAEIADKIGQFLLKLNPVFSKYNVVNGFLNISLSNNFWIETVFNENEKELKPNTQNIVIEFSSPNTNKPLHLGHIRNNLLGDSLSRILLANGNKVTRVNLVNDRGIHICKSMLAAKKWGKNFTPQNQGIKGDKLVGNFYVQFDKEYKKQQEELINEGKTKEEAEKNANLILEAAEMLRKWESNDKDIIELWKKMNDWVYQGFEKTYKTLGINFDKIYYESNTYKLGKDIILKGLENKILTKRADGSVIADLTGENLDEKVLLRADGTSVYMTQDIGTAESRYNEFRPDKMIYVVGNEQNYHFNVLKIVLKKLGYNWAENINHFSYGMVELPDGKMKSREGTVVDADDLIEEMISTAKKMSDELGKLDGFSKDEKNEIYRIIGLGALKYYILKVDPKKNMVFNPAESIDFNGNTGPFIQYTYARINSLLSKSEQTVNNTEIANNEMNEGEKELTKLLSRFQTVIADAGNKLSPAIIANYAYDLAKTYNQFYHENQVLKAEENERNFRLLLSKKTGEIIKESMFLLGIEVPSRM